jgi:hypothetical protein
MLWIKELVMEKELQVVESREHQDGVALLGGFTEDFTVSIQSPRRYLPYFKFIRKASEGQKFGHVYAVKDNVAYLLEAPYRLFYIVSRKIMRFLEGDSYTKRVYMKVDPSTGLDTTGEDFTQEGWSEALANLLVIEKEGQYLLGTMETSGAATTYWATVMKDIKEGVKSEVRITDHACNFEVSKQKRKYPARKMFKQFQFQQVNDVDRGALSDLARANTDMIKDFLER